MLKGPLEPGFHADRPGDDPADTVVRPQRSNREVDCFGFDGTRSGTPCSWCCSPSGPRWPVSAPSTIYSHWRINRIRLLWRVGCRSMLLSAGPANRNGPAGNDGHKGEKESRSNLDLKERMSTSKTATAPEIDELNSPDHDSSGFRIHWYRCNVCGADFEDANPSHRRRLHLLLEHKHVHAEPIQN
jgi:hypothetical protein